MTLEEAKDYLYATLKVLTKNTDEEIRAYIEMLETESPKMTIAELEKEIAKLKVENNGKERTMKVDLDEMADRVAEKALDEFTYNGKTLREWIEIIVAQDLLAITELEKVKTEVCEPNEMEYFENSNVWQKWFCNLIDKRIAELKGKNNE